MKETSFEKPQKYRLTISEDKAFLKFTENVVETEVKFAVSCRGNEEPEILKGYEYDSYSLTVPARDGLEADVSGNPEAWLAKAKQEEKEKLSASVRQKRDALLAETDKEMAFDRLNITIPDKINTSSLLTSVKSVFEALSTVFNSEMAKYRQALRDVPQQDGFPYDVKFPEKPIK